MSPIPRWLGGGMLEKPGPLQEQTVPLTEAEEARLYAPSPFLQ